MVGKKREEITDKRKKVQDASARSDEFKRLFKNIVYPVIVDCIQYLDKKGEEFKDSSVNIGKTVPEIEFHIRINFPSFTETNRSAEIMFSRKDDKVNIVEKYEKGTDTEILLEKAELTTDFVKNKLTNFIKSFLNDYD